MMLSGRFFLPDIFLCNTMNYFKIILFLFGLGVFSESCQKNLELPEELESDPEYFENTFSTFNLSPDTFNWRPSPVKYPLSPQIDEISGIVPSYANKNCFWVHEDSGSDGQLLLFNSSGTLLGHYTFHGYGPIDMEDITTIPNYENTAVAKIIIGDFGDNNRVRTTHRLFLLDDIALENSDEEAGEVQVVEYVYPETEEGNPVKKDCEALMADPVSKSLYFFTKEFGVSSIYRMDYPYKTSGTDTLIYIGRFRNTGDKITAADISSDGTDIIVKTYGQIFYWERDLNLPVDSTLNTAPHLLPYQPEVQGEAICFSVDQNFYVTISEVSNGVNTGLHFYYAR